MQIAIIALGSRGDVQPYVALGRGLQDVGHSVRLVTHEDFEALGRAYGLDVRRMEGNVQAIVETEAMRRLTEQGNFIAITMATAKEAKRMALLWARDGLAAIQGADLIVAGIGGLFNGLALAEKLDLPLVQAHLAPVTPTRAFPSVLLPPRAARLGGAVNQTSHWLTQQILWQGTRGADNAARREVLGLPPAPFLGPFKSGQLARPVLYGFSPTVVPKPADWGEDIHVTGYWFLDQAEDWLPPDELSAFLESGPPPVYVGFGSMGNRKPEETTGMVLKALAQTGQRAILMSGWGGLRKSNLPAGVLMVESAPHAWLFPRMAAVVHHGGAGTTAAGLRAGVPSIITPFFGDQGFWGTRVAALGAGPQPIPRKQLTAERLAASIEQAVTDSAMRERAASIGEQIRAEDGIGNAARVIGTLG